MDSQALPAADGAAFTWMLEHIMAYPGSYELPLRKCYDINSRTHTRQSSGSSIRGNAFPSTKNPDSTTIDTASEAAQMRASLMAQIAQQPTQPQSLPPSFITSFVSRCFSTDLTQVDFPQALTALDYLKDLEMRRRNEILNTFGHLGIDAADTTDREKVKQKYPNAVQWLESLEEKERRVQLLYTHVYLGLRRWALINEMSLTPFSKQNCLAMLNTLYPPTLNSSQFVPPTHQLTQQLLATQRSQFFRYITAVEKNGTGVLSNIMKQHARPGEEYGWPKVRNDLDNYLRMANSIVDECLDTTGRSISPRSANFPTSVADDEQKRKVDSGISFGSGYSSNRSSGQSHATRPSTSSSFSTHSRRDSKEKNLPDAPQDAETATLRPAGSALERIARELRKIGSRNNMREDSLPRPRSPAMHSFTEEPSNSQPEADSPPPTPAGGRGLRWKRSLKNIRSSSRMRSTSTSRPGSRNGSVGQGEDVPTFDAESFRRQKEAYLSGHPQHAR